MSEFRKLVQQIMENHDQTDDLIGPPTFEQWSLANLMQGYPLVEDQIILVEHPSLGTGTVVEINESGDAAQVEWDRLGSWTQNSEYLTLEEASRVVVLSGPKYLHNELSEDTAMTNIDLTGDDLQSLFEGENGFGVPAPSDTILTKQSEFGSGPDQPLSGLDGDGGATNEPHEEGSDPSDAPGTPAVASMDEPSRKAKIAKGGGGGGSNQFKKKSSKSSSDSEDNSESESESKSEDDDMTKKNESFTFEEADFEGIDEMNHMDEGDYMEHDMASGEIAVTQEFLEKLLAAAVASGLDADKITMVADCVADCCGEDRTLDVEDIATVMSKLKDKVGGGADDAAGDDFDGEDTDAALMGGEDDMEECGDMEEGSEEDRSKGRMRRQHKKMDKTRQHSDGGQRPKYRKPKPARGEVEEGELPDALKKHMKGKKDGDDADKEEVTEARGRRTRKTREQLDEAWMMALPNVGNKRDAMNTDGMSEEDIEIAEIKRLARI